MPVIFVDEMHSPSMNDGPVPRRHDSGLYGCQPGVNLVSMYYESEFILGELTRSKMTA